MKGVNTDALAVEVIFVDFSHLVFIADLSGLRVLARPVETLLQTTDLLGLQENLPLEILTQLVTEDVVEVLGHDSLLLHTAVVLHGQDDWILRYLGGGAEEDGGRFVI
ncbi:hypothetical protein EYF80_053248 [Liparis tanakae]|uniref:Uncharacterized protein n=1 Tax=Liparis tanakae TaxID=230148 RepID=A0A4Z2F723_9TELE|nr:hypothetical protein EYF80_053248 [Liparis tanakae]